MNLLLIKKALPINHPQKWAPLSSISPFWKIHHQLFYDWRNGQFLWLHECQEVYKSNELGQNNLWCQFLMFTLPKPRNAESTHRDNFHILRVLYGPSVRWWWR